MIKLQEIEVHVVSPFKDGSIHFLKIKLLTVENACDSDETLMSLNS